MRQRFDAIIIGSGQAGPFLAARLAVAGRQVALIEREHLGGTCVNDGCMPTKTLVASARAAHIVRRAADYGVRTGPVDIDMPAVKARMDKVVQQSVANLTGWLQGLPNLTLIRGHARFVGPQAIEVNGQRCHAPQIFVNVGGRAVRPDWPGLDDVPVLDNTSILTLDAVPGHLIVVGGSYIGLEFAQIYRRFGARVTVLESAERIVAREDAEVSRELALILGGEGIELITGVGAARAARTPSGEVRVSLQSRGAAHELVGSHLLAAVGRRPNTDDLGLAAAGIETDLRGCIRVDDQLRTSAPGVWALGDVNGRGAFTHTAYNDYEIVAANLLDGAQRSTRDRIPAYALFTDPPLARIGMDEAQVRASGRRALVGTMPMTRVGRARERGETQGYMKVWVDAQTLRILGATLLCIDADEIVHALLDVMAADAPCTVVQRCVHIHPTVSELIPTLLGSLTELSPD
jgi:pyruvate/2-oxoglutarate dehydrogenase complex dihydrolipoamide dehydrogenase (E3) component